MNNEEFQRFWETVTALDKTTKSYHHELVYPGFGVKRGSMLIVKIVPYASDIVQLITNDCPSERSRELAAMIQRKVASNQPFALSPIVATAIQNTIHLEPLGQSMYLTTIPAGVKVEVVDGIECVAAIRQLMATDPDAIANDQILLTLILDETD